MYKVFVNDKPIILTTSLITKQGFPTYLFKSTTLERLIYKLKNDDLKGVYLFSVDLYKDWSEIKKIFKPVIAAGGLVLNDKKELLYIYRGNKWDLPKGKVEKGEGLKRAALREVEEECGLKDIVLKKFLTLTYHLYEHNGKIRLKATCWYLMYSSYRGILKPQLEEGITEVSFKDRVAVEQAMENTYENIKLVYQSYLGFDCK
ncbi:MAG: NUDIX hydrolase [Tenacibaculum sp.]